MADLLGSMRVEIVGDNSKLDKSMKESQKKVTAFGSTLSKVFAGIGFAVVAKKLFDLGKQAENLFKVQELAETKLDATLKATASAAGLTADELKRMASGLQDVTTFGDEAIIGAESLLLTFKDIGGDVFPRALESILDVSTAMGQDLKSSTVQLGKALNDPVGGIAALTRVGIQFTDEQKALIKTLTESGDVAAAQGVILEELESQFGGVSRAAALTSDGINQQLNNSFGDLLETIGGVISEGMTPYRENLKLEVESINDSITAHLIRKKAIAGNATEIENLTLRQIEQEKTEKALAQAKLNVLNADKEIFNAENLSEVQIKRIEGLRAVGLKQAENTIIALEDELVLRKLSTAAAEEAVENEKNRIDANILLAQGIESVTIETENNTEAVNENTEASFQNASFIQAQLDNQTFAHRAFTEAIIEDNEEIKLSNEELWTEFSTAGLGTLTAIDSLASATAAAELQRLEESGASQEELDTKKKEIARDEAKRKKALGLLSTGIDTASAIIGFLANPGGIAGVALSILAGVTGGVQAAAIAATPIPSFADGGIVPGRASKIDNTVANVASGELIANQGMKDRMLMEFLKGGGSQGGNTVVQAQIDKKVLFSIILEGSKNGQAQFDNRSVINK